MTQGERKAWLLSEIQSGRYASCYAVLRAHQGEFSAFEAIPFGLRNQLTHICMDLTDGRITRDESLQKLVEFVQAIPDEA